MRPGGGHPRVRGGTAVRGGSLRPMASSGGVGDSSLWRHHRDSPRPGGGRWARTAGDPPKKGYRELGTPHPTLEGPQSSGEPPTPPKKGTQSARGAPTHLRAPPGKERAVPPRRLLYRLWPRPLRRPRPPEAPPSKIAAGPEGGKARPLPSRANPAPSGSNPAHARSPALRCLVSAPNVVNPASLLGHAPPLSPAPPQACP